MTATKVFIARLAGLPVYDPNGDRVGRLRDVVVVVPRVDRELPRVLGLVMEIQQRKRIFVPMSRVTSLDAEQLILGTGTLSLKRFERRVGETLVLEELLDRRVTVDATGAVGVVIDVAMEQARSRTWVLSRVAVRTGGGIGRRRGQVGQYAWSEVSGISLPAEDQGAANLLAALEKLRPADLASLMHEFSGQRRSQVAAALDDERLADVLEELPEEDQVEILGGLEGERAADVLEAMDPDDAADLLGELPTDEAERLLELMAPQEAAGLRNLLSYSEDTAGGMMTTDPVVLPPNASIAEALARVRAPELSPALASQVYVVRPPLDPPTGKFLGVAHIQRLLREPPSSLIGGVLDSDIAPLSPDTPLARVTAHFATYDLVAAAVVDGDQRLIGAVTVDDVLDHLLPDDWRDRAPERLERAAPAPRATRRASARRVRDGMGAA